MLALPNECLIEIFNNLRTNYKCLFSCLLVNRHWCRIIIPILWREPLNHVNNRKLISSCLLSLNAEEQALLIPFKIILPNNSNPLFEYTSYTEFVGRFLYNGITSWLNEGYYKTKIHDYDERVSAVRSSLIAMFLRTSKLLKYLKLRGTIYYSAIKNLRECNTIISLKICFNHFNSEGIKALTEAISKFTYLTSLEIYDRLGLGINNIGTEGAKTLANALYKNTTLTSLCLSDNSIDAEGVKALAEALSRNTTLTSLFLDSNNIGDEGGKLLAKALHVNTALNCLVLHDANIGIEGGKKLAEAFHKNNTLDSLHIFIGNNISYEDIGHPLHR
ncbi:RNI-like protein [Gigaspora margarita]|uniref:RNI-like protein n=1 Tax=Gigaspora margarita TaxID=4874 RepID=A0A8H4EL74_GIGMA|nr:RNI-like protein [Gigaspora margarita]